MTNSDRRRRRSENLLPNAAALNTENLTPLQRRVWRIATGLPEAETVALAGSGGLIVRGVVDRHSRDVDLFATNWSEVNRLVPALADALADQGFTVEVLRDRFGFAVMQVEGMGESTGVDIGIQMRLLPTQQTPAGTLLALDDLAAGKFMALFDRAAERDYIDVAALTERYTFAELCGLTEARQPRFDRSQLADQLSQFNYAPEDFGSDALYNKTRRKVRHWLQELTDQQ